MLIDNIRSAWKLATVWVGFVAIAFGSLPADSQAALLALFYVPEERLPALIGLAVLVARVIKQSGFLDASGK